MKNLIDIIYVKWNLSEWFSLMASPEIFEIAEKELELNLRYFE